MEDRPISFIMKEMLNGLSGLVRGEIRLARAEMTESAKDAGKQAAKVAVFGIVAWLGVLALLTASIIGLGQILGDVYWLSALIIGVLFVAVGSLMALQAVKRIKVDASLRETRRSLERDKDLLSEHVKALPKARESDLNSEKRIPA